MNCNEFVKARIKLNKTQKQIAELLGLSIKAVHSYEQDWRKIPAHVERQLFFLLSRKRDSNSKLRACWTIKKCPKKRRNQCPAWEFQAGKMCWFINGTICECQSMKNWEEKMEICKRCEVLADVF